MKNTKEIPTMKKFEHGALYKYKFFSDDLVYSILLVYNGIADDNHNEFIVVRKPDIIIGTPTPHDPGDIFSYNSRAGIMTGKDDKDYHMISDQSVRSESYSHYISYLGKKYDYPEYFL